MSAISDIKKAIADGKAVIGAERVIKGLKRGGLSKIYLSSNCADDVKEDVTYCAKLSKAEVVQLEQPNDELGTLCKKPFIISVLGIAKSES